jgi:hypothetical protein
LEEIHSIKPVENARRTMDKDKIASEEKMVKTRAFAQIVKVF